MPQPTRPQLAIYLAAAIAVLLIGARFLRSQDGAAGGGGFGSTAAGAATNGAGGVPAGGGGARIDGAPDGALAGSREGDPPLAADGQVFVDVKGAVRRPGVYRLGAGARAMDAVRRAGGVTRQADRLGVNLAARVTDGGEVVVPRRAAGGAGAAGSIGAGSGGAGGGAAAGAGAAGGGSPGSGAGAAAGAGSAAGAPGDGRPLAIDINTASAQELELLDGVGPSTAARIIAYREANGGFSSIDELDEVSGIGEARLAAIRAQLGL